MQVALKIIEADPKHEHLWSVRDEPILDALYTIKRGSSRAMLRKNKELPVSMASSTRKTNLRHKTDRGGKALEADFYQKNFIGGFPMELYNVQGCYLIKATTEASPTPPNAFE